MGDAVLQSAIHGRSGGNGYGQGAILCVPIPNGHDHGPDHGPDHGGLGHTPAGEQAEGPHVGAEQDAERARVGPSPLG